MKPKVGLVKGNDRGDNVRKALRLIGSEIDLSTKSNVFIKVNFVSASNQLAATHVDAVRSLLEFLRERYKGKITIGESAEVPAVEAYRRFGYLDLAKDFNVELVDISEGDWVPVDVYDSSLRPMKLRYSRQIAESDYRIVIGPPKTHDVVVVTLSIKNLAMGALYFKIRPGLGGPPSGDSDKHKMHQGHPVHNLNLYLLARAYPPDMSIIDGYLGMEGNGPLFGKPVQWGVAIASRNPVAADCLAANLMGFPITDIGYLWYCTKKGLGTGDPGQMEIMGAELQECYHRFTPPPDFEVQKGWRDERVAALIGL